MELEYKEPISQENKPKQSRIKIDLAFCLSILLVFIILAIAFSQYKPKEQEETENTKFPPPLPKTQIEQLDKQRINLLPSFDLWIIPRLTLLQERLAFQNKTSCELDLLRAISLYKDNYKPEAFTRIFVAVEHLIGEKSIKFVDPKLSNRFCQQVKALWKLNVISRQDAKILFEMAKARNLLVHVSGYTINTSEVNVLLNKSSFLLSKLSEIC